LRTTTKLKTPDAIHAATAQQAACALFVTNDAGFRAVAGLPLVVLSDLLKP
jgi:predicted nucleic acid-binding protein